MVPRFWSLAFPCKLRAVLCRHATWINPLSPLVGRSLDLAVVQSAVAHERLVTLTGLPGVGKSRLAAAAFAANEGWLALDLTNIDDRGLDKALAEAGSAAGLFLDNADKFARNLASALKDAFHRHPHLRVLLASRLRTGLAGEWVYELCPLPPADGCDLLHRLAESANPRLRSAPWDGAKLVARVGGLPLAIERLAQTLRAHDPQQLIHVERLLPYLTSTDPSVLARHRSIVDVFEDALSDVSTNARHALQALSSFADVFTPEMAAELLGVANDQPLLALAELIDASLVTRARVGNTFGFTINALVREHMLMTCEAHLTQEHQNRLRYWARKFVDTRVRTLPSHQLLAHLTLQEANLVQAVLTSNCLDGLAWERDDTLVGEQLLRMLGHRGELQRAHELANHLLRCAQDDDCRARLLRERAKIAIKAGDLHAAAADVAQAAAANPEPKAPLLELEALLARRRGDAQAADALYAQAVALASAGGDRLMAAAVTSERASLAFETIQHARAKALFQSAQDLMREAGSEPDPVLLTNLALLHQEDGELLQAEETLQKALALHEKNGNKRFYAITLSDLAGLAFERGCGAKAAELYHSAEGARADTWDTEQVALVAAARSASLATLHDPKTKNAIHLDSVEASIKPAVSAYLALERFLLSLKNQDAFDKAEQGLRQDLESIAGHPWAGMRDEIRLALRIARRYLEGHTLLVRADGSGFRTQQGAWVDLRRRSLLGRLLHALATNRLQEATAGLRASELIERGWPGEQMREDAASNRLYVALSELRKLGLGPHLPNTRERYRLSDQTMVLLCPPSPAA